MARETGLRRFLHGRRLDPPQPPAATPARFPGHLRPLRVLVAPTVQRSAGGAERRRQHRLVQRQYGLLEGSLRERSAHAGLLQDRRGSGSSGSGAVSANDWGPDGILGTADDALGLDGIAGTADDKPQNATTTFRDNGRRRAIPMRRREAASARSAGESDLRRDVRRRQRLDILPTHGSRRKCER